MSRWLLIISYNSTDSGCQGARLRMRCRYTLYFRSSATVRNCGLFVNLQEACLLIGSGQCSQSQAKRRKPWFLNSVSFIKIIFLVSQCKKS